MPNKKKSKAGGEKPIPAETREQALSDMHC